MPMIWQSQSPRSYVVASLKRTSVLAPWMVMSPTLVSFYQVARRSDLAEIDGTMDACVNPMSPRVTEAWPQG